MLSPRECIIYENSRVKVEEKSEVTELAQILHLSCVVVVFKYNWGTEVKDAPKVSQPISDNPEQIWISTDTASFQHEHGGTEFHHSRMNMQEDI